jgi:uncharacterized protein involved in cysteine biosynthesis
MLERRQKDVRNRFKLAFVALLIATIVWGILFYLILQEYREYIEGLSELERIWGTPTPWVDWNGMPYVILAGMGLLVAWALLIASYSRARDESRKV